MTYIAPVLGLLAGVVGIADIISGAEPRLGTCLSWRPVNAPRQP
jgi:hypothetical protein